MLIIIIFGIGCFILGYCLCAILSISGECSRNEERQENIHNLIEAAREQEKQRILSLINNKCSTGETKHDAAQLIKIK